MKIKRFCIAVGFIQRVVQQQYKTGFSHRWRKIVIVPCFWSNLKFCTPLA
jgi:hypothetical protein